MDKYLLYGDAIGAFYKLFGGKSKSWFHVLLYKSGGWEMEELEEYYNILQRVRTKFPFKLQEDFFEILLNKTLDKCRKENFDKTTNNLFDFWLQL